MKARRHAVILLRGITISAALSLAPAATLWADPPKAGVSLPPSIANVQSNYGQLPLSFEANQGQVNPQVQFLTRGRGHTLLLTPSDAVLMLRTDESKRTAEVSEARQVKPSSSPPAPSHSVVRMTFEGANPQAEVVGLDKLPGLVNHLIGDDPTKWRTNIPTYKKVEYKNVYAGIDLVYYGNHGQLEYDLIVAPGADPTQIRLAFEGSEQVEVDEHGDLAITVPQASRGAASGEAPTLRLHKPVVYQRDEQGEKHFVDGTYALVVAETLSRHSASVVLDSSETPSSLIPHVAFQLAAYDASKPLIIDPVLSWATYLGGSVNDVGYGIAVDAAGSAYVTGGTNSLNFPITAGGPVQSRCCGPNDIFVTKLNAAGTALVYSTYLGGSDEDLGRAISIDAAGSAYVTGHTRSSNFPMVGSPIQGTLSSSFGNAFVIKLNPAGTTLSYSTYLGGTSDDSYGHGIAVDTTGSAYVTGRTSSSSFPGTAGNSIQSTLSGFTDAFVTKLNPAGTALIYSTYLGGSVDEVGNGIAVDTAGNAYVTGATTSLNFPGTVGSLIQSTSGSVDDAFVTKLNPAGTALIYSTYLGGNLGDEGLGIAVDATGSAYVTGRTSSLNFPITAGNSVQGSAAGLGDAFVTKLNPAGTALAYSTYLGSHRADEGNGIAVDTAGSAYVTGQTTFPDFPGAAGSAYGGGPADVFVTKLNPAGTALDSTYLGGVGREQGNGIAVNAAGNAYVTGLTDSSNFPGTAGSVIQSALNDGSIDAYVAKISFTPTANAGPDQSVLEGTLVTLDGTVSSGGSLTYSWTKVAGPPSVALTSTTTAHPTFTAPNVPAAGDTVTFELVVCEGTSSICSEPDSVNVRITDVNHPPVSQAGPDQTVQESNPVNLDGTASYDPDMDTLTYQWSQILGPAVTLMNPTTVTASFTAPSVAAGGATLEFDLTVKDPHNLTGSDKVSVVVKKVNQPPVANAGPDQTKNEQTLVTLDGSASSDPDLDTLSYTWTQTGGPAVVLAGASTASPTFTAPEVTVGGALLTFKLTANDGQINSSVADTVHINVQNVNDPPVCTLAQASPNLLWPPNHTMTQVSITGITDPGNSALTITYTSVKQDEPINGLGDGDTSPDAIESGNKILLRAERAGTGNGRVYVVQFTAADPTGAQCSGTVRVSVPHNKKDTAGEGPQLYNSFAP